MKRLNTKFRRAEDSPGFMLWKASNLLQRMHNKCLGYLKITPTQFSLMTCLVYLRQEGPVSPSRIVKFTGMDKMVVSDLVKTLEKKGVIQRVDNPEDRRSFFVEPTRWGRKATNSAVRKVEVLDTKFFQRVKDVGTFHTDLIALVNHGARD